MIPTAGDKQEGLLTGVAPEKPESLDSPGQQLQSNSEAAIDRSPTETEKLQCRDQAKVARMANSIKEQTTREVTPVYTLLFARLNLTSSERHALLDFLIQDGIARTSTSCVRAMKIDPQARSQEIAAIIGETKLQQFLSLEHYLGQYSEVLYMQAILEEDGVPMTESQRNSMLEILIKIQDENLTLPGADADLDSIEYLEYMVEIMNERDRLVFEQAPSILSGEQVERLFAQYQLESNRRAEALERQKKARSQGDDSLPLYYPARNNPDDSQ